MRNLVRILFAAFSCLSCVALTNAQQVPTSYLFLEVIDSNKQPVAGAKVESASTDDYFENKKSKLTDEKGLVSFVFRGFDGLPNDFVILKSGYYNFDVLALFGIPTDRREYSRRDRYTVELLKIPKNRIEKKLIGNEQLKREFFLAVMKGDTPKVHKLLRSGIDPNISTDDLRGVPGPKDIPAILYAADNIDIETINEFLGRGVNLRKENSNISNILSYFVDGMRRIKIEDYASLEDYQKQYKARQIFFNEYMDRLIKAGADLKSTNPQGEVLLTVAARHGNVDLVKKLLERGAAIDARNRDGSTTLLRMFGFGYTPKIEDSSMEIINLLLKSGADPNVTSYETGHGCHSPLMSMAEHGQLDFVKLLLSYKADINLKCKTGEGALNRITQWRNLSNYGEVVRFLADAGADVNSAGEGGITPLMIAVDAQNILAIKKLLSKGAAVNAQDKLGRTALIFAIQGLSGKPSLEVIELLLTSGADPNITTNGTSQESFGTALSGAVWHDPLYCTYYWNSLNCWYRENVQYASDDILKLLIANKADVNLTIPDKDTPLVSAAKGGRVEALRILIEAGAKTRGEQGQKALKAAKEKMQWAKENSNYEDVIKILEAEIAKE